MTRDGDPNTNAMGQALNIHKGGPENTSSEGCQTLYSLQGAAFYNLTSSEMKRYKQIRIPYLLVNNPD